MIEQIKERLTRAGVRFIRFQYCDNANMIRSKAVPLERIDHYAEKGVGLTKAAQAQPAMFDTVVANEAGLSPVGEIRLMPDWSSLQLLPYAPTHASVMCDMYDQDKPWEHCPRSFLKTMLERAKTAGLEIKVGQEFEFVLFYNDSRRVLTESSLDSSIYAQSSALDVADEVINVIVEYLDAQGIEINLIHAESAPGQLEVSLMHSDVLNSADNNILFRQSVKAAALNCGLSASFLPKPYKEAAGSGCHLNLSLWQDDTNIVFDANGAYHLGRETQGFMAGILHHLPALMAVTAPSVNSYRRFLPHYWSGAYCSWGEQNRESALRVAGDDQHPSRFELKTMDASANPYLAMGVVIAAGLDGIEHKRELPKPYNQDPGLLTDEQRNSLNINRLPITLLEAVSEYQRSDLLKNCLGNKQHQAFYSIRKAEWDHINSLSFDEEVQLLLERY